MPLERAEQINVKLEMLCEAHTHVLANTTGTKIVIVETFKEGSRCYRPTLFEPGYGIQKIQKIITAREAAREATAGAVCLRRQGGASLDGG